MRQKFYSLKGDGVLRAISLALIVSASLLLPARADVVLDAANIQTSGEIGIGRLYGYRTSTDGPGEAAFSNALIRAQTYGVPILVIWSSDDCHYCDAFTTMLNTREAQEWMASQYIYFTYFKTGGKAASDAYRYVYEIGSRPGDRTWPATRLTWVSKSGTGADEAWGFGDIGCTFRTFTNKVLTVLKDYQPPTVSKFLCGNPVSAPLTRLEASSTTKTVYVPIQIPGNVTNDLLVTYSDESISRIELPVSTIVQEEWAPVLVDGKFNSIGETIKLALVDRETNICVGENAITYIGEETSGTAHNPLWIGERTASTLAAGEWTLDLDVATNRTAQQSAAAYTLVNIGGELWCPDCIGTRTNLLETASFRSWALENNVALALIDVARLGNAPTLMSHTAYKDVSGTPYLSRKGIDQENAAEALERFHTLAYETFNPPYESRTRAWLPTFFLLRKDGTAVAKYCGDRKYPDGTSFTVEDCIRRLNEMIQIAADTNEWSNNDWTTTQAVLTLKDAATSGTLSAIDGNTGDGTGNCVIDVFRLEGTIPEGASPVVSVRGTTKEDARIKLSLGHTSNQRTTLLTPNTTIVNGSLLEGVTSVDSETQITPNTIFYATLEGADTDVFNYSNKASTIRAYEIAADWCLVPSTETRIFLVEEPGSLKVSVKKGSYYEFGAGTPDSNAFESIDGLWRARQTGLASITFDGSCTLAYRHIKPSEWGNSFVTSVASSYTIGVNDTCGAPLVGCISGKLPKGLSLTYSSKDHAVKLTGVPSDSSGTYESTWCIAERTSDGSFSYWMISFTCSVTELDTAFNPFGITGVEIPDCPIVAYDPLTLTPRAVIGTFSLSVGANGRLKARYINGKRSFSFPMLKGWTSANTETGELQSQFIRGNYAVDFSISPDGFVDAVVTDPDYSDYLLRVSTVAANWSRSNTASAWKGQYTLSLSPSNMTNFAQSGTGRTSLALRLTTATDLKRGRISYSGRTSSGLNITGNAYLNYTLDDDGLVDTNNVQFVIFKRLAGGRILSGLLTVEPNAAVRHTDWPQSIRHASELPCVILPCAGAKGLDAAEEYEGFGGYYDPKENLLIPFAKCGEYQSLYDLGIFADESAGLDPLALNITSSRIKLASGTHNPNFVKFAFNRTKGYYSGSFRFTADGSSRRASFFGVLMPGWVDCQCGRDTREVPFGTGSAWISKKKNFAEQTFTLDLKAYNK